MREQVVTWMYDYRFGILDKYKKLSDLKHQFGLDENDILNLLLSHLVLSYLDEYAVPIFDAYEAFDVEDLSKIIYGSKAEIEAAVNTTGSSAGDEDTTESFSESEYSEEDDFAPYSKGSSGESVH